LKPPNLPSSCRMRSPHGFRQVFVLCWLDALGQDFPSLESWSYQYPQYWKDIIGASCSSSTAQSPIDIPKTIGLVEELNLTTLANKEGQQLGPFAWSLAHWTANVTLHPGPVTWEVQVLHPEQFPVHFEGRTYDLQYITFKSPSEHTVEGAHNAMEVQLYHEESAFFLQGEKRRLVVSVSLRESTEAFSGFLNPIFSVMPQDDKTESPSTVIGNPYVDLAPPDKSFVTYQGSITVPPCSAATWVVFLEPQYIGTEQLEQFRSSISGYQPSRLAPANYTRPLGLSDLWDSRWGYNSRGVQALNSRSVTLVQMANADPAAVPKLNRIGSDDTWRLLFCLMLMALLATGCLLLLLKRIQNSKELAGCCDYSDEDEDIREFQPHPQHQAAASLLSPLPDPYMHMAPARAGFAKHDQIYLG